MRSDIALEVNNNMNNVKTESRRLFILEHKYNVNKITFGPSPKDGNLVMIEEMHEQPTSSPTTSYEIEEVINSEQAQVAFARYGCRLKLTTLAAIFFGLLFTFEALTADQNGPKSIPEAVKKLESIVTADDRKRVMADPDSDEFAYFSKPFLMTLRNNWLNHDNELTKFFCKIGVYSSQLMLGIIIDAYLADLRGEEFDLLFELKYIFSNYTFQANLPSSKVFENLPEDYILIGNLITANSKGVIQVTHISESQQRFLILSNDGKWKVPTKSQSERIEKKNYIQFPKIGPIEYIEGF